MSRRGTETEFDLTTIERLIQQQCGYTHGEEIEHGHEEVVLRDVRKADLTKR